MSLDLFTELMVPTQAFDAGKVEYALCGGLALAVYGAPRFTKDIDVKKLSEAENWLWT